MIGCPKNVIINFYFGENHIQVTNEESKEKKFKLKILKCGFSVKTFK